MIEIPIGVLLSGIIAWAGNKALPAVFAHKTQIEQTRFQAAKDLCENHNDCEAYKLYAMQGLKYPKVAPSKSVEGEIK